MPLEHKLFYALGLILNGLWLALILYWLVSAWTTKRRAKAPPITRVKGIAIRSSIAILIIILIQTHSVGHGMAGFKLAHTILGTTVVRLIAFGIAIAGIFFAFWARHTIGQNWGVPMSLRENHELVTSGPYGWVRHPLYSGLWLAMVGTGLFFLVKVFIVLALLSGVYYIIAATCEERTMLETFPQQYPPYQKRTKMFIPFII